MNEELQTSRLDKWLKISRMAKTRTKAAVLCEKRKVKVNNVVAKPSKIIKIGDTITINRMGRYRQYEILGISSRSIPAKEARELYKEIESGIIDPEMEELRKLVEQKARLDRRKYKGRPTKKERRGMQRMKGQ